jgi:hypothetical protein
MGEEELVTFQPAHDLPEGASGEYINVGGLRFGWIKKAQFGPGWFLQIFGTKWQNAPGARYPQELDMKADFTYCKTKRKVLDMVVKVIHERAAKDQRRP